MLLITTSKSSGLSEHAVKMAHRYFEIPIPMSLAGGLCGFLSLLALFVILLSKRKVAAVREIALVSLDVIAEKLGALQQERTRTVLIKAKKPGGDLTWDSFYLFHGSISRKRKTFEKKFVQ